MKKIAVCAPATALTLSDAEAAKKLVATEFPEFSLYFHEQCFLTSGHFAGSDRERLEALVEVSNDPGYDVIWFARGGYGSNRIADAAVQKMNENAKGKTFIGFSDTGYLLAALYRHGIGLPVHGPMPVSAAKKEERDAFCRVMRWLCGDQSSLEPNLDFMVPRVAFNLMTLAILTGTNLIPHLEGHILFVEEVGEHIYSIDRLFFHISKVLPQIRRLRLGSITEVPENDREFGQEVEEIAKYWCSKAKIPYLGRAEIGHTNQNMIVPFGTAALPLIR